MYLVGEGEVVDGYMYVEGEDADDVDIPEEYEFSYIEGDNDERYDEEYEQGQTADAGAATSAAASFTANDAATVPTAGVAGGSGAVDCGVTAVIRELVMAVAPLRAEVPAAVAAAVTVGVANEDLLVQMSDIGRELLDQALQDSLADEERQRACERECCPELQSTSSAFASLAPSSCPLVFCQHNPPRLPHTLNHTYTTLTMQRPRHASVVPIISGSTTPPFCTAPGFIPSLMNNSWP